MAKWVLCKSCGCQIAKSAKVCPRCGAPRKRHTALGIFLVIIGVVLFIGGMSNFDTSSDSDGKAPQNKEDSHSTASAPADLPADEPTADEPTADEPAADEPAEPKNKPTISMDEFESISTGMTYDEVVEIVGSEGELLSEVDMDIGEQYKTSMYMWKGEGSFGANANVTFQGGEVIAKAQIGLK